MTPLAATELVYGAAKTGLDSLGVALTFDGERFEPPPGASWVRVAVRELPKPARDLTHGPVGGRRKRYRSSAVAQVFAPNFSDDGSAAALTLAQQVKAFFEAQDLPSTPGSDPLNFETAEIRRIGADGAWYQVNVTVPFTFDEVI